MENSRRIAFAGQFRKSTGSWEVCSLVSFDCLGPSRTIHLEHARVNFFPWSLRATKSETTSGYGCARVSESTRRLSRVSIHQRTTFSTRGRILEEIRVRKRESFLKGGRSCSLKRKHFYNCSVFRKKLKERLLYRSFFNLPVKQLEGTVSRLGNFLL